MSNGPLESLLDKHGNNYVLALHLLVSCGEPQYTLKLPVVVILITL